MLIQSPAWRAALPAAAWLCRRAARAAYRTAGPRRLAAATIVLADDRLARDLNRRFRGKDRPTNVLAFPADSAPPRPARGRAFLGDVVIAHRTSAGEARRAGRELADHLSHLIVHGILHLLGYDHRNDADARRMERKEIAALAGLGIADPYAGDGR